MEGRHPASPINPHPQEHGLNTSLFLRVFMPRSSLRTPLEPLLVGNYHSLLLLMGSSQILTLNPKP